MLESALAIAPLGNNPEAQIQRPHPRMAVYRQVQSDRTAGPIPSWTNKPTAQEEAAMRLARGGATETSFESALAYASTNSAAKNGPQPFGFFDFVDIVNPLQHIPLVGTLYREVTGDEIKSFSKLVGGGLFGGVAGVAGSAVNIAVEEETGKDVAGNILAMARDPDSVPDFSALSQTSAQIKHAHETARLEDERTVAVKSSHARATRAYSSSYGEEARTAGPTPVISLKDTSIGVSSINMPAASAGAAIDFTAGYEPIATVSLDPRIFSKNN